MPTFSFLRDETTLADAVFDVAPLTDTANPFGDYAVIKLDDTNGDKFDEYERGTRVDVSVDPDDDTLTIQSDETVTTQSGETDNYATVNNAGTYSNAGTVTAGTGTVDRFTGYVVERRENEQSGADVLEVEAYSFDQFLRRNTVTNDQQGKTISAALEDIVKTDTPVTFNAANINVGDDQELTRSYRGEKVENALRDFAFKSNNEEFGVNDSLEFFFRPRETTHIDRGIDNTQWFNYDIPELGKETINEVEVWFADGEKSVVVDDGTDKLDLQDSLGLPDPGTQRAELQRPLITDISDAEDIGRKYLKFRTSTLSGTVTTFGLYDAEPGDTIDIQIPPRGIDDEFVVAAIEYRWGRDETQLTIVEKRGGVDDILADLSDSVQRQEMSGANRDAPKNRITTTNATALVDVSVDADGNTPDAARFVNDGRRAVRDAWTGDAAPDITTLVVGTDGSGLSRSNTALRNQVETEPVTQSLPDATTVRFTADSGANGVQELGLEAADGTLVARVTFDSAVDLAGDVEFTLSVSNDASVSRGVLTTDGQTAVRDVLADNSPALPSDYAYGAGDTLPTVSDTSLEQNVITTSLTETVIQDGNTTASFTDFYAPAPDNPVQVTASGIELQQSLYLTEAENADDSFPSPLSDSNLSNGAGIPLFRDQHFIEETFTINYDINDSGKLGVLFFVESDTDKEPALDIRVNGITELSAPLDFFGSGIQGLTWLQVDIGQTLTTGDHLVEIVVTDDSSGTVDGLLVDIVTLYDGTFSYNFSTSLDGNGYLPGPELFPTDFRRVFDPATSRQRLGEARFDLSATDVSNDFFVELSDDGGNSFTRVNNSKTGSVTFSELTDSVTAAVNLGPTDETRTTATPTTQFNGQTISEWELTAFIQGVRTDDIGETVSRGTVSPNTITGETIREAGLKSGSTLLTRHVLAEFDVLADQRLASSETTEFAGDN